MILPNKILSKFSIFEPPVNIFGITTKLNIKLFETDSPWDSASQDNEIYLNKNITNFQKNFLCAHQLGHRLLHNEKVFRCNIKNQQKSRKEIDADNFAFNLLTPSWMMNAFAPLGSAQELSITFKIPINLMINRLKNLGFINEK